MKRILGTCAILTVATLMNAATVRAESGITGQVMDQGQQSGKNECLLVAMNCGDQVDSIQQRIGRLEREISRGTDVYTNDELKQLNNQLRDYQKTLEGLERDRS